MDSHPKPKIIKPPLTQTRETCEFKLCSVIDSAIVRLTSKPRSVARIDSHSVEMGMITAVLAPVLLTGVKFSSHHGQPLTTKLASWSTYVVFPAAMAAACVYSPPGSKESPK
ncbi:hypothetical protein ACLB2K_038152 [Fragaria x ananassa]